MALTATQEVTVAEITRETLARVLDAVSSLTAEQITAIQADITTWNLIRDSHVKVKGGTKGIDFDNERKRAAIRQRTRLAFGWSTGQGVGVFAGGISIADNDARAADADRVQPLFTTSLHQSD